MNALGNVSSFLIETLFTLYIGAVVLRQLLAWSGADFYNAVSQFLVTITSPVLVPLRRIIPSIGRVDTASVVLALGLTMLEVALLGWMAGVSINIIALVWISILKLLELVVYIYIFSIIIQAIMSWIAAGGQLYGNPVASLLYSLNEPILAPLRRVIPRIGMVDLSPLVAIIGLNVVLILLRSL